jgi:hypothetical protein
MTLFLAAILVALLAGAWVALPLLERRHALLGDLLPGRLLDVEARKRVALAALKEVEYDRAGGKLDDADYRELRGHLEREALVALEAADGAADPAPPPGAAEGAHACGFRNPAGSRFCSGCGQRLG